MSGAMQRETERAEDQDLAEGIPKTTTVDDRLVVVSFPGILDDESRARLKHEIGGQLFDLGLDVIVLDAGAEVYRPSAIGALALQLTAIEGQVAALAEAVEKIVAFIEAGEEEPQETVSLDGDPGGRPRDAGAPL